jgi:uncharacterized membrane protein
MKNVTQGLSTERFGVERGGGFRSMMRQDGGRVAQNVGNYERVASGLSGAALIVMGLRRGSLGGVLAALGGAAILYRGVTGHSAVYQRFGVDTTPEGLSRGVEVARAITIGCSPDEAYRFWRNFENLPAFMHHLASVTELEDGRSHWVAREAGIDIDWYAQIIEDVPGERIVWRSEPGGRIETDGEVLFRLAPGNRGTEVHVRMRCSGPGRVLAMSLAPLLRRFTRIQVGQDLRRMKQLIETGEIATGAMRNDELRREGHALPSNQRIATGGEEEQEERRVIGQGAQGGQGYDHPVGHVGGAQHRNGQGVRP